MSEAAAPGAAPEGAAPACAACGTELSPGALACPACGALVHAARLKALAAEAERHAGAGDLAAAMAAWRRAQALLPAGTRQLEAVTARLDELSQRLPPSAAAEMAAERKKASMPRWARRAGPLGVVGLLLWKLKFLLALALGQGKLLLVGLTKGATFWSMLVSLGLYWTVFGWKFALGFILSIYVHEMGHVQALRRHGIAATAPMFIPGLGAVVRLKQYPVNPVEDARVGLAGPVWGLGAALACLAIYAITGAPLFAALARSGAYINLFNLVPVWQLDGSRGLNALDRRQRWLLAGAIAVAWALTLEGLLLLLLAVAVLRALGKRAPERPHAPTLVTFIVLIAALSALSQLPVPSVK
jgi:Zn-dependent protease